MKKLVIAMFLAGSMAAPASAGHLAHFFEGKTFKNKGECQSALMHERNNRRNNDGNTGGYSDSEYNQVVHDKYSCTQNADGDWVVTTN